MFMDMDMDMDMDSRSAFCTVLDPVCRYPPQMTDQMA